MGWTWVPSTLRQPNTPSEQTPGTLAQCAIFTWVTANAPAGLHSHQYKSLLLVLQLVPKATMVAHEPAQGSSSCSSSSDAQPNLERVLAASFPSCFSFLFVGFHVAMTGATTLTPYVW